MPTQQITYQQLQQHLSASVNNVAMIAKDFLVITLVLSFFVLIILFACSLQKTMNRVPKEKRIFPNWFIWMRFIPFVGMIFEWMMIPFGIPGGVRNAVTGNASAQSAAITLKIIGLFLVICESFGFFVGMLGLASIFVMPVLVVLIYTFLIIYWVKVVSFRKKYLM